MSDSSNNFSKLPDGYYVIEFESGWEKSFYLILISENGEKLFFPTSGFNYNYENQKIYKEKNHTIEIVLSEETNIYQVIDDEGNKGIISSFDKFVKIIDGKFKPSNRKDLLIAINIWLADENMAKNIYGDINTWDVTKYFFK